MAFGFFRDTHLGRNLYVAILAESVRLIFR